MLRRQTPRPRLELADRALLAAVSRVLPRARWSFFLVKPGTAAALAPASGRRRVDLPAPPDGTTPLDQELQQLVVWLVRENPRWGYQRIRGKLLHFGIRVSATAIRTTLRRHRLDPAPGRAATTWRGFLRQQAAGIVACDLLTVESIWLRRLFVLCFIEHDTRRVHLAGVTANPSDPWVTQQARNLLLLLLGERGRQVRFLLRDRDAEFSRGFDDVVRSEGAEVLVTPVRAPRANAYAERWVRTVRAEGLDWLLVVGRGQLDQVRRIYVKHDNEPRPHRALGLEAPDPPAGLAVVGEDQQGGVHRRDLLGGLREYRQAASTALRTLQADLDWITQAAPGLTVRGRVPMANATIASFAAAHFFRRTGD